METMMSEKMQIEAVYELSFDDEYWACSIRVQDGVPTLVDSTGDHIAPAAEVFELLANYFGYDLEGWERQTESVGPRA
jgi:hypothetical protein